MASHRAALTLGRTADTSLIKDLLLSPIRTYSSAAFHLSRPASKRSLGLRNVSVQALDERKAQRERIVVIGSGWAGYGVSRTLDSRKYQVVVVSPRSYFVFTPLLASTSVGTLEYRTAIEPVRTVKNAHFLQAWVDKIDFDGKRLTVEEAVDDTRASRALVAPEDEFAGQSSLQRGKLFDVAYDKLVIAVGSYSQTFGTKGVKENAFFLKDVGDARRIRTRILSCFEKASMPTTSQDAKRALLNFAVVGGGPTGIEWAAEMHDLIEEDLKRLYPDLHGLAKITVYDVAPKVLSMFDARLAAYATRNFARQAIEIKTSHHVLELRSGAPEAMGSSIGDDEAADLYTLKLKEEGEIAIGMCVWSTGLMANPLVDKLSSSITRHAKTEAILTDEHLRVKRTDGSVYKDVFALGDCAVLEGTNYPATAQVASQKAIWLGKRLNRGDLETRAFTFRDLGIMAYTGGKSAIVQAGGRDVSGWAAWVVWRGVYLTKSVSWRNKILIPIYWSITWLFGRDISRF